jgi:uncharacterized protein (TIGR03086 family)
MSDGAEEPVMSTDSLARAFSSTRGILVHVERHQFANPTPCASWNVREATMADEDYAAGDFLASYDETKRIALCAFGVPGTLERTFTLQTGECSGSFLIGLVATDQFVHGWDLARATGQTSDLDPELANELLAMARQGITDALRGPDAAAFGPVVETRPGASPTDRLAAFLGRSI